MSRLGDVCSGWLLVLAKVLLKLGVAAALAGALCTFEIEILDDVEVVHQTCHSWVLDLGLRAHRRLLLRGDGDTFWGFEPF